MHEAARLEPVLIGDNDVISFRKTVHHLGKVEQPVLPGVAPDARRVLAPLHRLDPLADALAQEDHAAVRADPA